MSSERQAMAGIAEPSANRSADDADFCTGCGGASCAGCSRPLDPPRFCPACGRRLTVAVTPGGYRARCRHHGQVHGA
ncbi:MAG TPA: hypothetical protein VMV06_08220 [Acidimicrobiales bacterium]|nr:hypothetical protein [Acidimicrobiales bacterium]